MPVRTHRQKRKPVEVASAAHGLDIMVQGDTPDIDIVAIHGLNGHRDKTWKAKNGVNWLRDLLPDVLPNARILSWGYLARTHGTIRLDKTYLYDQGVDMVAELYRTREFSNSARRPIIFIAHSLGGIVLKSALFHASAASADSYPGHRSIKLSTYGIIFLGTPHQGVDGARLGQTIAKVASVFVQADDRLLKTLEPDSEWLRQQTDHYAMLSADFVTKCAYEVLPTPTALGYEILVVPKASAVASPVARGQVAAEPVPLLANHKTLVKYASKEDENFKIIAKILHTMACNAGSAVREVWAMDVRSLAAQQRQGPFYLGFSLSGVAEVEHFVGRQDELAAMHSALEGSASDRRSVVVHGLGGMGKTQLAIEFLKRYHKEYSAVAWLNAASEPTLQQSFASLAQRIAKFVPEVYVQTAVNGGDIVAMMCAAKRWLEDPRNNNWLLVFDNYDHPQLGYVVPQNADEGTHQPNQEDANNSADAFDIRPYFPETQHGGIVITTRCSGMPLGQKISLKKLEKTSDGVQILKFTSGRSALDTDPAVLSLATKLDGLPLALATAGAYLGETQTTCGEYINRYDTEWVKLQETSPKLLTYGDRALFSTWNISYEKIKAENGNAAQLLKLWSYFRNEGLWYGLFQTDNPPDWLYECTQDEITFHKTMGLLVRYGLVESSAVDENRAHSKEYSIHECVYTWVAHVLNRQGWDTSLSRLALQCIASAVPESTIGPFFSLALRRVLYHATVYTMDYIRADLMHQGFDHELTGLARMRQMDGDYDTAAELCMMAFRGYAARRGLDNSVTNEALSRLGLIYLYQGKINDAAKTIQTAFRRCSNPDNLGPDHFVTLKIGMDLAAVYEMQGKDDEARTLFEQALKHFEATLDSDDDLTLHAILSLASLSQGEFEKSEALFQRALQQYEMKTPPDKRRVSTIFYQISDLHKYHGNLEKAEEFCQKALHGWKELEGADTPIVVNAKYSLGKIYQKGRNLTDAKDVFRSLLDSSERLGFADHNMILDVCCRLGRIHLEENRPLEAEPLCRRSLEGYEARFGFQYDDALRAATVLAAIYRKMEQLDKAQELYGRAYTGCREMWAGDGSAARPRWAAIGFVDYGDLMVQRGDPKAALEIYREMLPGLSKHNGETSDAHRKLQSCIKKLEGKQARRDRIQAAKSKLLTLLQRRKGIVR